MKRDFQQSTNAVASGVLPSPVFLPQVFRRSSETSTYAERTRFSKDSQFDIQKRCEEGECYSNKFPDTLFQRSLERSPVSSKAVEKFEVDPPVVLAKGRFFLLFSCLIGECRDILRALFVAHVAEGSLECALSDMIRALPRANSAFQAFATGKSKALKPEIHEQVCLIGQEALVNAFRHSQATLIEVEVEYRHRDLRLVIRDNGRGIDPEAVRAGRNSHWGLLQMEERARVLGAQLCIWSRRGLGTEIEVLLPV